MTDGRAITGLIAWGGIRPLRSTVAAAVHISLTPVHIPLRRRGAPMDIVHALHTLHALHALHLSPLDILLRVHVQIGTNTADPQDQPRPEGGQNGGVQVRGRVFLPIFRGRAVGAVAMVAPVVAMMPEVALLVGTGVFPGGTWGV